jgi:hypothetical protein
MLSRPGCKPGPAWMRNISDSLADADRVRKTMMPFWLFLILYLLAIVLLTHFVTAVAFSREQSYQSPTMIGGQPLVSYGFVARGVVAIGAHATGVIALGGIAVGVVAIGGLSLGVFSLGGAAFGIAAFGAMALGWRAVGGLAVGRAALGGLAVGRYAYAGNGVAYGSLEASGRQKEHLIE